MTPRRHLLSHAALLLSFPSSLACAPSSSEPEPKPEGDVAGSSYQLDLAPEQGVSRLEVAYLGTDQPVYFETQELVSPEGVVDIEPQLAEWLTATVVDTAGEVVLTEVLSASCPAPSTTEARTWLVPTEVATIQEALDLAAPGDTVRVEPGTYYEHLRLADGVRLVGSGAGSTILDGNGEGQNLVTLEGGHNVLVRGFTLRGVGQAEGCATSDPTACSGNWYASALYVAPFEDDTATCGPPSIIATQNVFEDNDIGMMAYFQPHVVLRNNVFLHNRVGFVANHHADGTGLISQNVFFGNEEQAVALSASYIDVVNNIFASNGVAIEHEHVQRGRLSCNVFFGNSSLGGVELGLDGNVELDPMFVSPQTGDFSLLPESAAMAAGCLEQGSTDPGEGGAGAIPTPSKSPVEAGIHGGIFGTWSSGE